MAAPRFKGDDTRYSGETLSPDEAYWLGFLLTDGNLSHNTLALLLHAQDSGHLTKFAAFFGASHRVPLQVSAVKPGSDHWRFTVTSKVVAANIRRWGMHPNKTWTATPPTMDTETARHFWRGCLDGDGSIHLLNKISHGRRRSEWRLTFCGNSHMVGAFASFVCETVGVSGRLSVQSLSRDNRPHMVVRYSERRAESIVRLLYWEAPTTLQRKADAAAALLARREDVLVRHLINAQGCTVPGCGQEHLALGYCRSHYANRIVNARRREAHKPFKTRRGPYDAPVRCSTDGCANDSRCNGLCQPCHDRKRQPFRREKQRLYAERKRADRKALMSTLWP